MHYVISTEVYAEKAQKKESVANTFTSANNNIEHFFCYQGREKLSLFLKKMCKYFYTA